MQIYVSKNHRGMDIIVVHLYVLYLLIYICERLDSSIPISAN